MFEPNSNANYRAVIPMQAMAKRGHALVWPGADGRADAKHLAGCDLVFVYRRAAEDMQRLLARLASSGTPIVYDNDDDFTTVPVESPDYRRVGGEAGRKIFELTVRAAKLARCFTTTTPALADRYREAGVERIEVIGNYLSPEQARPRRRHEGVVIGWVGGRDHAADTARIDIVGALRRLMDRHPQVSVECIGVDLGLPTRYRHDAFVPFPDLPARMGGWDIGIAPLADIPVNRMRSDIKLKEYAASGLPWVASAMGPYRGLGKAQGGVLADDGEWFDALDRLVSGRLVRMRLGWRAKRWARSQTIRAAADRWERILAGRE